MASWSKVKLSVLAVCQTHYPRDNFKFALMQILCFLSDGSWICVISMCICKEFYVQEDWCGSIILLTSCWFFQQMAGIRWLRVDAAALYFLWFHNPLMLTDEYFHRQHNTLFHVRWATTSCFFLTNCTEISEEHQETPNFLFLVISIHLENLCLLSLTLHQFSILSDFLLFVTFDIYH